MTFVESVKTCLTQKYAKFEGRATRSEFWWFYAFYVICAYAAQFIGGMIDAKVGMILGVVVALALLLPNFGVFVRRMHDIGKSGWSWLWGLIPCVGGIILLVFCIKESQPGDNQYGPAQA